MAWETAEYSPPTGGRLRRRANLKGSAHVSRGTPPRSVQRIDPIDVSRFYERLHSVAHLAAVALCLLLFVAAAATASISAIRPRPFARRHRSMAPIEPRPRRSTSRLVGRWAASASEYVMMLRLLELGSFTPIESKRSAHRGARRPPPLPCANQSGPASSKTRLETRCGALP